MILPEQFTTYTRRMMGERLYNRFAAALDEPAPVSVRLNAAKWSHGLPDGERVPWCEGGFYLNRRPQFTFSPLFRAGAYYVQEASSMFVEHVIKQYVSEAVTVLDMCAAPGGKSTAVLGALPTGSVMVCNEPIKTRAQILSENIQKWGNTNVIVTNNYPADIASTGLSFDVIICDVPCSGEGMFRKDSGVVEEWSVENVGRCRLLQRSIVAEAWRCLRNDGIMIYSTCTFNTAENEENIAWICSELGAELLPVSVDDGWNITGSLSVATTGPVYRFIPGLTRGEGLFVAVLRKTSDGEKADIKSIKAKRCGKEKTFEHIDWLANADAFDIRQQGDDIIAIPKKLSSLYDVVASRLRILSAGVTLATTKGRDLIPAHALALSTSMNRSAFPEMPLNYSDAVKYLRHEAITLPINTERGYVVVSYDGLPLGFVKNIGSRANNMYPQEWKIKSTHIPDELTTTITKQRNS